MKTTRAAWRGLEPVHAMIYFVPEGRRRYTDLGLSGRAGYFTPRSAAFGLASAELVIATFYSFNPALVRQALDGARDTTTPQQVLAARYAAAGEALRRAGIHELPALDELVALTRRAAEAAGEHAQGRPLFAAPRRAALAGGSGAAAVARSDTAPGVPWERPCRLPAEQGHRGPGSPDSARRHR
ncbi:hypothetical protein [Streptomyces sp. NPDC056468]|uniref:helix-turn-helix domain-containing protein n=1 Tax=Streptomyces sp. NPDC056468 TaxID=3345830 RepID=UPI00368D0893